MIYRAPPPQILPPNPEPTPVPKVYTCPISQFEKNYDDKIANSRIHINDHMRAVRMLEAVANAAHDMGKNRIEIAGIDLTTEHDPLTQDIVMSVVIRPKWGIKPVTIRQPRP